MNGVETAQVKWVTQGQLVSGRCGAKTHNSRRVFLGFSIKWLWVDNPASWGLGEGLSVNCCLFSFIHLANIYAVTTTSRILLGKVSTKKNVFSPRNSPSKTYFSLTRPWTWGKTWNIGLINGDTELRWEHAGRPRWLFHTVWRLHLMSGATAGSEREMESPRFLSTQGKEYRDRSRSRRSRTAKNRQLQKQHTLIWSPITYFTVIL